MKCYAVSYDLIGPNRNYEQIHKAIRNLDCFAYVHESLFIVQSYMNAQELFDVLIKSLDSNDKLLVIELGKNASWIGLSDDLGNWLKSKL